MAPYGAEFHGEVKNSIWHHGMSCGICRHNAFRATSKSDTRVNKKRARRDGKMACAEMD